MSLRLDVLDHNGVGEAASALAAHQGCLDRLAALTPMSAANERLRQALAVNIAGPQAGADATRLAEMLANVEASPAAILLRSLPISGATMLGLGRLSLVAAALGNIRRVLGVSPLQANAPQLLADKLRSLAAGPLRTLTLPASLPGLRLPAISQFGGSVGALRSGLDVDILAPNAGALLRGAFGRLQAVPLLSPAAALPIRLPTLLGLQQFGSLMAGLSAAKQTLGIDLLAADVAVKLAGLAAALRPGGPLALACALPSLPQLGNLTSLTNLLGTMRLAQQNLGVNLLLPDAGLRLQRTFGSLSGGQVCQAATELSAQPLNLPNVNHLQQFAGAVASSQAAGVDLMAKDAAAKLAKTVDGFRGSGRTAVEDLQVDEGVLAALSVVPGLAELGEERRH